MFNILKGRWNARHFNLRSTYTRQNFSYTSLLKNNKKFDKNGLSYYKSATALNYAISTILGFIALSYISVPVYRALCARTGFAGQPMTDKSSVEPSRLKPVDQDKRIRVKFSCETSEVLPWKMTPEQNDVYVLPGETALAFYKAKNYSDKDIIGMATYSITPGECSPYFNKIQCFCFEEQKLNAGEEVDMPVFFFIDPEFVNDSQMQDHTEIILHYSFFKATYSNNDVISTPEDSAWSNKIVDSEGRVLQPVKTVNVRYDE